MTFFGFYFSLLEIVLLGIFLFVFFIQLYYYLFYFSGIIKNKENENGDYNLKKEGVSVIICAKNEEENLKKFLPQILEQDYPNFEVIVINDASTDDTDDYLSLLKKKYNNLKTTFVPNTATNLSTKKLGLSLGIKASKNEILLFTDADCVPSSKDWIKNVVKKFTPKTDFVIGYGGYLQENGFLNKLIKYDTLFIAIQYLGMAYRQKAYMGVGRNMAYRKSAFNRLKGFTGTLNLASGDDDLLINRGATADNVRIVADKNSTTWSEPKKTFYSWLNQKRRHLSVSNRYNKASKLRLILEPFSRGLFYLLLILTIIFGNVISLSVGLILFLIRYGIQIYIVNKSAEIVNENKFYLLIPVFDILLPLISFKIFFLEKNKRKFSWK